MFSSNFSQYSSDGRRVTVQEFQTFLSREQGITESLDSVATIMREFLVDPSRNTQVPYFHVSEFVDWLFSARNTLASPAHRLVMMVVVMMVVVMMVVVLMMIMMTMEVVMWMILVLPTMMVVMMIVMMMVVLIINNNEDNNM